jgi:hypothetical protein
MRTVDIYVHADREGMWGKGAELGLVGEELRMFSYGCSEVRLTIDVNDSGAVTITHVDGRKVEQP